MANRGSYELHHHFPKLADESGFTFNVHRPRTFVDWQKIRALDVESIIKERKFYLIEQHLNDILHCSFESEFDVRILDEGVLKIFRLAQLAVEYQQFCRHYLDRSVYVLREEITTLTQELDNTKRNLHEKEEELKKVKRKTKHTYRTPFSYGNDNIATMILKTLSNKGEIFRNPSTSNADGLQYNKCSYCDKVFLNQLYLKSHITRRHSNTLDVPQKDDAEGTLQNILNEKETSNLNDEIAELKNKLKEMEDLFVKMTNERNNSVSPQITPESNTTVSLQKRQELNTERNNKTVQKIIMKDAEVSTNTESNLLDKIEEWKKEEYEKYNKEINLLRTQIVEIVNSFKTKETDKYVHDENLIEQLNITIKQQGAEIHVLRQELNNARLRTESEELDRKKEIETQMTMWAKRVEVQMKQYDALLQKLNEVAQEAREARAQAEAERSRAAQLQVQLQETLNNKPKHNMEKLQQENFNPPPILNGDIKRKHVKRKTNKPKAEAESKTLDILHRKAQELLNMRSISSSDISSSSASSPRPHEVRKSTLNIVPSQKYLKETKHVENLDKSDHKIVKATKNSVQKDNDVLDRKEAKVKKEKSKSHTNISNKTGNGAVIPPGSPKKLVRAKITEEVNHRLVSIGVDPLKKRLPKSHYKKQKLQIQQQHESKSKKNPEYQKIKHSILAYLDSSTPIKSKEIVDDQDYVSPNRTQRAFSLTSVISNVKNKALSLVKTNDANMKARRKEVTADVAQKAMALLKTPPSSAPSSPVKRNVDGTKELPIEEIKPLPRKRILTPQKAHDKDIPFSAKKKIDVNIAENSSESDHKYYNSAAVSQSSKSIDNLIKSPARRPSSANAADYGFTLRKLVAENMENNLLRSQSAANILDYKIDNGHPKAVLPNHGDSSEDLASFDSPMKKEESEENIPKHTKGVLKNASSTSSLNKKKVVFDMDAIQMKSVSASPSQSITEKNDNNEKFELGLLNLDGEEWDISSIDNEPLKEDTKIPVTTRTSPKIAELKHTIESQLARRNDTPSTALVGGVNLMPAPIGRNSSIGGSNTSLGSSILDESYGIQTVNHKAFIKTKKIADKEDSEVDISEYSFDGILNKKRNNDSF